MNNKERVLMYYKITKDRFVYPSEVADSLSLGLKETIDITRELISEGKLYGENKREQKLSKKNSLKQTDEVKPNKKIVCGFEKPKHNIFHKTPVILEEPKEHVCLRCIHNTSKELGVIRCNNKNITSFEKEEVNRTDMANDKCPVIEKRMLSDKEEAILEKYKEKGIDFTDLLKIIKDIEEPLKKVNEKRKESEETRLIKKAVESINKDGGPNFKKIDKILMAAAEKTYNKKELDKFDLMSIYKRLEEIELRLKQLEKK